MTISLTNASGDPVSSFGSGNSQFAEGNMTNPSSITSGATFGQAARSGLSNAGFSNNTVSPASQTVAGNTQSFGYSSLGGQNRGARGGGGMGGGSVGGALGMGGSQSAVSAGLLSSEPLGVPEADTSQLPGQEKPTAVYQVAPPQQQGAGFWDGIHRVQQGVQRARGWMSSAGPEDAAAGAEDAAAL